MHEDNSQRALAIVVNAVKFSSRELMQALRQTLEHWRGQKSAGQSVYPKGKQSVKQLIGQGQGVSNIDIKDTGMRAFDRVARKYGVDYAVKKDRTKNPPRYLVFFKAKDADALTACFAEYTHKQMKAKARPSVRAQLKKTQQRLKNVVHQKVRRQERER